MDAGVYRAHGVVNRGSARGDAYLPTVDDGAMVARNR